MSHSSLKNFSYFAHFFIVFFLFFGVRAEENQQIDFEILVEDMQKAQKWIPQAEPEYLDEAGLLSLQDVSIDNLLEYEVRKGFRWKLSPRSDSLSFLLSIFEMPSQTSAFGVYSAKKSPSMKFFEIGFESFLSGNRLLTWYGNYVLIVSGSDSGQTREKVVKELTEDVVHFVPRQKPRIPLLESLPEKNRVKHSEKFYRNHWLDQDYFRNIFYADYYTPDGYSRIFIIDNRSTAAADSNFWRYFSFMKNNAEVMADEIKVDTDFYVVLDPLWGKTILAKKNQIIYGILDYRNKDWTEDRMKDILNNLKKRKIVKSG